VIIFFSWLFWLIRDHQNYFKKRNVKYLKSPPFLGCLIDAFIGRKGLYENFLDIYNTKELKDEAFFGVFMFHKPGLVLKDPELIKKILITDFHSFGSRYATADVHDPIGYYQLFLARYPEWKQIRPKLTPFFSSAKLKNSYYLIDKLGNDLTQYFHKRLRSDNSVELNIKNVTDFYFVDVISSIAFGVEAHSLEHSGSEIMVAANSFFNYTIYRGLELTSNIFLPQILKFFNFKNMSHTTDSFIYKACPDIIAQREKSGVKRNDLIDTLIVLKNELKPSIKNHTVEDMIYGQVGIFLAAGMLSLKFIFKSSSLEFCEPLFNLKQKRHSNQTKIKLKFLQVTKHRQQQHLSRFMS
jgi:cytochrome P450 family 6